MKDENKENTRRRQITYFYILCSHPTKTVSKTVDFFTPLLATKLFSRDIFQGSSIFGCTQSYSDRSDQEPCPFCTPFSDTHHPPGDL